MTNKVIHPFKPLYDKDSKILILGSFPSVKSREQNFYYGHPQNRFWKVIAKIYDEDTPITVEDKKLFLHKNHIALWDSIQSCEITGSADSSITNVKPNDINNLLNNTSIKNICCNGKTSYKIYDKYIFPQTHIKAICLPSTSPANAVYTLDKLIGEWKIIK